MVTNLLGQLIKYKTKYTFIQIKLNWLYSNKITKVDWEYCIISPIMNYSRFGNPSRMSGTKYLVTPQECSCSVYHNPGI